MDEHQHREHVKTHPGETGSPENVPHAVKPEPGSGTQVDGINVAQVATVGTFIAVGLLVLVLFLQAWFYRENDAEQQAKTIRQDDPSTPYGHMKMEHEYILNTGKLVSLDPTVDAEPDVAKKKVLHQGVPIQSAMKMVVDNPRLLSQPLGGGN